MTKYFIVSTDPLTDLQIRAFKAALPEKAGWWYWLPNFWLIKDPTESLSVSILMDKVGAITSQARAIAIEVDKRTWAARTRKSASGGDMAEWLRSNWNT